MSVPVDCVYYVETLLIRSKFLYSKYFQVLSFGDVSSTPVVHQVFIAMPCERLAPHVYPPHNRPSRSDALPGIYRGTDVHGLLKCPVDQLTVFRMDVFERFLAVSSMP
jgi:hypothetical protein